MCLQYPVGFLKVTLSLILRFILGVFNFMIRYLANGERDFSSWPDPVSRRTCWEFYLVYEGAALPDFSESIVPTGKSTTIINSKQHISGQPFPAIDNSAMHLWLIRPGFDYRWKVLGQVISRVVFHFSHVPPLVEDFMGESTYLFRKIDQRIFNQIILIYQELIPHYLSPTNLLQLHADRALAGLCLSLLEDESSHKPLHLLDRRESERIEKAKEWYQANIRRRPTIAQVADAVGISISQLRRDFQYMHGVPPQIIFRRLRLYEAKRLMSNSDWTLDRIFAEAGFASKQDFHRSFKAEHGLSPHQWRRRISLEQ